MWLRLARRRITLPVPVNRNRFPAPLWVFIFGMVAVVSVSLSYRGGYRSLPRHAQQSPSPALALRRARGLPPRRQKTATGDRSGRCCYRLGRTRYHGAVAGGLVRRRLGRRCRGYVVLSGWRRGAVLSSWRRRARAGDGLAL